jgi:hypothetical protein
VVADETWCRHGSCDGALQTSSLRVPWFASLRTAESVVGSEHARIEAEVIQRDACLHPCGQARRTSVLAPKLTYHPRDSFVLCLYFGHDESISIVLGYGSYHDPGDSHHSHSIHSESMKLEVAGLVEACPHPTVSMMIGVVEVVATVAWWQELLLQRKPPDAPRGEKRWDS